MHSQDHILPEVAPTLGEFARKKMEEAGISILLNTRAVAATHEGIELNNGKMLTGATVVCTIGTAISPPRPTPRSPQRAGTHSHHAGNADRRANQRLGCRRLRLHHQRIRQQAVRYYRPIRRTPRPPSGAQPGASLERPNPQNRFRFKALGQRSARSVVTKLLRKCLACTVSGFLAWFLWRGVYLFKLPTLVSRESKVGPGLEHGTCSSRAISAS